MKKKIAVLTGAGISHPSGLETFRTSTGLWNGHDVDVVATFKGFVNFPEIVHNFYNQRRNEINSAIPNIAHNILSELQKDYEVNIFTQNIDDLHEKAGSTNVHHLHGTHNQMRCLSCHNKFSIKSIWDTESQCPVCEANWKKVRPDIVWFEEQLDFKLLNKAEDIIRESHLYLQIGTSAKVAPVNKFFKRAKPRRKRVEVNLVRSNPARLYNFHAYYMGDVIKSMPVLKEDIEYLMTYPEIATNKIFN